MVKAKRLRLLLSYNSVKRPEIFIRFLQALTNNFPGIEIIQMEAFPYSAGYGFYCDHDLFPEVEIPEDGKLAICGMIRENKQTNKLEYRSDIINFDF